MFSGGPRSGRTARRATAALGATQIDAAGNVNVSRFGHRLAGVGGFVNTTQNAKRLVFCGTFTASGLQIAVEDGEVRIVREGKVRQFIQNVEQLSFAAKRSLTRDQPVLYVTERAVFRLTTEGVELIEIAPGLEVDHDLLAHMDVKPIVRDVQIMARSVLA